MLLRVVLFAIGTLLFTGCPRSFDPTEIGPLTFKFERQFGDFRKVYEGEIPAEIVVGLLSNLVPREEQYRNNFMQRTTRASLEYNGAKTSVSWTPVKLGERVYIFKVRGGEYVLREPHSLEFEKVLETYGTTAPRGDGGGHP